MGIDDIDILLVQVKFRSKLGGARCSSPGLRPAPRSSEPCLRGTSQGNCRYIPSDIVLPYNHRLHRSATFIHQLTPAYPVHSPHNVLVGAATMQLVGNESGSSKAAVGSLIRRGLCGEGE
jgi:hypothetical protein